MYSAKRNNGRVDAVVDGVEQPLTRVELHVHLDGSVRHETVFELAKEKKIELPGRGSYEELLGYLVVKQPGTLATFLQRFDIVLKCLKGDLKALERLGYEFVEDCKRQGIAYAEARFCPHILIPDDVKEVVGRNDECKKWVWDVTGALIKGLQRGRLDFGSHVNLIATVIRGKSSWYDETLELALDKDFHAGYICGVDIAALPDTSCESHMIEPAAVQLFDNALKHGLHRTAHAGESGGASQVTYALDTLHSERIGHGYRIVEDQGVMQRVKKEQVHLECCPWSSLLTGAVKLDHHPHPIVRFFQENYNVSVNTDDPTMTGTRLDDEYSLLYKWGLRESHFVKGSFNAAKSCFLPATEKKELIQRLAKFYGVNLNEN